MDQQLTALELKVMTILWDLEEGFVKDILNKWSEEPKPAYNTVSTVVRILEEKGAVDHKVYGRSHQYYPTITKQWYQKHFLDNVLETVFDGSIDSLVHTIVDSRKLSDQELQELKEILNRYES